MTEPVRNRLLAAAMFAGIAVLVAIGWAERDRASAARVGTAVPDYAAPALDGDTVALDALRGRVVLLNIWATWCAPCRWEMPALERIHRELRDAGLAVVAVSVDVVPASSGAARGTADPVRAFVDEHGLTFAVLRDPEGRAEEVFGVRGLPTTLLIDRAGRVRGRVLGPAHWDRGAHRARIRRLLEE